MLVGASCTAELLQDDPGGLARALGLPIPVVAVELPAYQKKENWGAAETFYQLVRALARTRDAPGPPARGHAATCWVPTALGFRHRDDVAEITRLLERLGVDVSGDRAAGRHAGRPGASRRGGLQRRALPRDRAAGGAVAAAHLRAADDEDGADRRRRDARLHRRSGRRWPVSIRRRCWARPRSRLPWYSRSVDSTYLTGKRVFIFGDATHAIAAARIAAEELGFKVVGLGTYAREFAREVREAAKRHGVEALITDDYLEVEAKVAELQPELVLGTQMERHIAKRLGIPCAVISAPVHVQDFPARYSPQMGFEGANVIFDTWVHPLMMGLEEHLLAMFRDDPEFHDGGRRRRIWARAHRGAASKPPRASVWLGQRGREGTEENSVLRARQGAPQHRAFRPRTRPADHHSGNPVRCQSALRPLTARPVRVVVVTMDSHLGGALGRAAATLKRELPNLDLAMHAADEWSGDPAALAACHDDIACADIVIATMLFLDEHIRAVLPALAARRERLRRDAVLHVRRRGRATDPRRSLRHERPRRRALAAWLKRLRGKSRTGSSAARPDGDAAPAAADCCASSPAPRRTCAPIS